MTTKKHTPGPWQYGVRRNKTIWLSIPRVTPTLFDERREHHQFDLPAGEANARLIAAAPELLEAAQVAFSVIALLDPLPEYTYGLLKDAIAKAVGK